MGGSRTAPGVVKSPRLWDRVGRQAGAFPIVGIGCSAGGLEALEKFLSHVPRDSGMAYVVVQHLDPEHASNLAALLQRATPMPVVEAADGMRLKPDCVFIIPPGKDLSVLHGLLHTLEPTAPRGLRLPVDFFFRTLAEDMREQSIGVILSGMGSDGVFGLRAIKEKAGLVLVQDPLDARADSMPRSAIESGLADIIAVAEALPDRLAAYLRHPLRSSLAPANLEADAQSALEKVVILLRDRCGHDFSLYKVHTLYRRIERRIALHQLPSIGHYVRYLRENPVELDLLFKELLIGVTNFFRDPAVWLVLKNTVLPTLLAQYPEGRALRAWVPACSSGEEAFSLAMVFKEVLAQRHPEGHFSLQIYATDLDVDAIARARKGLFPRNIEADVSLERLARYFVPEAESYRIGKDIREMVTFAPQNVTSDPPFTRLDLLCCRNLLIYFGSQLQKKLLPLFHYALNRDGFLVLGSAETVGNFTHLFAPVDHKARIFQRMAQNLPPSDLEFPLRAVCGSPAVQPDAAVARLDSMETLTDQLIQQNFAPAAVLVNGDGDILYISGRTGKYLEPAAGKVNINIHAMAREGLREALTGVIRKALRQSEPVLLHGLKVGTNGGTQLVDVTVLGLEKPEALRGRVLMVFRDLPSPPLGRRRKSAASVAQAELEAELQQLREALHVAHEEAQTALEEYKSANEELQSTNEELQSTNEELTTSKEELQSLNEELQTVNAELESKVDDLTWVRNDMMNLLNSTEIATVFLDGQMKLRRFTAHATHLFKLIAADVGRPLSDIVSLLDYADLLADAQEVLRSLVFRESQAATLDGRHWFRVRIMPYRTQDNVIDGVVITFIDITEIKQLKDELQRCREAEECSPLPAVR